MKIKRIIEIDNNDPVYDIEVSTADHTFLLDDVRVENCRLLSQTDKLDGFVNSIGGSGLSIGSCRVSTINLMRIAYESKFSKKKYLEILRERALLNCKALSSMRKILKRNIEKGLLPNYQKGAVELERQFCTCGVLGMFEVIESFGLINTDEFGYKSYSDLGISFASEIMDTINEIKDNFERTIEFEYNNIRYKVPAVEFFKVINSSKDIQEEHAFGEIWDNPDKYEISEKDLLKFKV